MTDIATIEAALAAATPGPWNAEGMGGIQMDGISDGYRIGAANVHRLAQLFATNTDRVTRHADAHLIANAPTWLAELVTDAKRWQAVTAAVTPATALTLAWDKDADGNPVVRLSHGLRRFFADSVDEAVEKMGEEQ